MRLAAVSDQREARLEFIRRRYPQVQTVADAEAIIADSAIQAVVIATPPNTHYTLARRALLAGKHVLVEKPLTMVSAEAQELVELADKCGSVLAVGHLFLYAPPVAAMREMVKDGRFGEIYFASSTRANLGPPNTQVDVIWDLAPHDVSIILHLFDEAPAEVRADGADLSGAGVIEAAVITMHFPSGRMGQVNVNWLTANKVRMFHMVGRDCTVQYDETNAAAKLHIYEAAIDNRVKDAGNAATALGYGPGTVIIPPLPAKEPLLAECEDFVRVIQTGGHPVSDGRKGAEVVRVLETASHSIATRASRYAEAVR